MTRSDTWSRRRTTGGHGPGCDDDGSAAPASYSGGQVGECFTVVKRTPRTPPAITPRVSRHKILAGGSVRDFARLHRVTKLAGGTLRYRVYSTLRGCRADTLAWPARPSHGRGAGIVRVQGTVGPGSLSVRL
ncbi:MAG TPA: hypothetical protein VMU94_08575 [Streptosporangiaceae bacterium]|nr:hypothetical protein [Streptosporangiaceae bacterium]